MSQTAIILLIAAACAIQAWKRLSANTRTAIVERAQAMIRNIGRYAEALKNRAFRRRYAYKSIFLAETGKLNDFGQVVIADLTKFCRGLTSITFAQTNDGHTDLFRTGVAEGRREVLLHIMKELGLDLNHLIENAREEENALAA